jgi:hypothetical protein
VKRVEVHKEENHEKEARVGRICEVNGKKNLS